jgi:transcriptional regulator with XRE-family HTH domain
MSRFAQYLISARNHAGLSQAELASKIGVSDTYISAIETGRKAAPPYVHVAAIAQSLKIDEDMLWGLALDDRESRFRRRLGGIPTSSKSTDKSRDVIEHELLEEQHDVLRAIQNLIPTKEEREHFVETLDLLVRLLRRTL